MASCHWACNLGHELIGEIVRALWLRLDKARNLQVGAAQGAQPGRIIDRRR
jgi:hypothetical protein